MAPLKPTQQIWTSSAAQKRSLDAPPPLNPAKKNTSGSHQNNLLNYEQKLIDEQILKSVIHSDVGF
jgi:hypothetical protein